MSGEVTAVAPVFMKTKVVVYPPPAATCGKYKVLAKPDEDVSVNKTNMKIFSFILVPNRSLSLALPSRRAVAMRRRLTRPAYAVSRRLPPRLS